jgi:cyclic nucleotide-binding protein
MSSRAARSATRTTPRSRAPQPRPADAWWVEPARLSALVIFPALIVFSLMQPWLAGRVFWTVAVASLPLIFVLAGYHRWRRICPLAFVAQLPERVGRGGKRRAGPWLQAHAYHLTFGVLLTCLWLRLVATNGDGYLLTTFLVGLCLAAMGIGLVFTGKTWCNYVCPVSLVEKLYTEPRGLRETPNSQCGACTACRPACPDINEENSFWKEILQPAKRDVYFAFPGVVLAFYGYYFLQAGRWSYYFSGDWTREVGLVRTAFSAGVDAVTAGFYFAPRVPRAAAAALTLATGALAGWALLRWLEPRIGRLLERRGHSLDESGLRSVMFTIAAFSAFVSFYSFAGAPTLRLVPGLPHAFQLVVVATATLVFVRRINRRQETFAEETLARRIIANWKWSDMPPPRDLREAFLIHTIRSQSHEEARQRLLDLYKTAVRESVESGVVSRGEIHRLEALRSQLHISDTDHERVMAELADERGGLAAMVAHATSPEKQLQLETYGEALALHLDRQGGAADEAFVRALRERYNVTPDEHALVLDQLLQSGNGVAAHLGEAPQIIEWSAAATAGLNTNRSPVARFLVRLLQRRWHRAATSLAHTLGAGSDDADSRVQALLSPEAHVRDEAFTAMAGGVSRATAASLMEAIRRAREALGSSPGVAELLRLQLASSDPYLRATAFYLLDHMDETTGAECAQMAADEHPFARETGMAALAAVVGETQPDASTLEKMIGLRSIGIFDDLEPEDLAQLARAGAETWFTSGEPLCQEGELSDVVFVLLDGEVTVSQGPCRVGVEGPGSCIGELAVLDPAPRESTVVASTVAVRTLRLTGGAFRQALGASPGVSEAVIRILARRLRRALPGATPVAQPH